MKWSPDLRSVRRGIRLATRIAKTQLAVPAPLRSPLRMPTMPAAATARSDGLASCTEFGANPGRLRMLAHVPPGANNRPLVVVLHGCGQAAQAFAEDTGWIGLADRKRLTLVLPEQMEANNAARCFQWFQPSDTGRDLGEAGSIAAMTRWATERYGSDPRRVFIVGLSAGAAMAAAMLAAYPDLFAAGASVAGLPVGAAQSGMQAILRMASAGPEPAPAVLAQRVLSAGPHGYAGAWPRLSVWHGQADSTVVAENADRLTVQWCGVHGLNAAPTTEDRRDGIRHRVWSSGNRPIVEQWMLPGLQHGYPIGGRPSQPARFMLSAPVDATTEIARFLDLD